MTLNKRKTTNRSHGANYRQIPVFILVHDHICVSHLLHWQNGVGATCVAPLRNERFVRERDGQSMSFALDNMFNMQFYIIGLSISQIHGVAWQPNSANDRKTHTTGQVESSFEVHFIFCACHAQQ